MRKDFKIQIKYPAKALSEHLKNQRISSCSIHKQKPIQQITSI